MEMLNKNSKRRGGGGTFSPYRILLEIHRKNGEHRPSHGTFLVNLADISPTSPLDEGELGCWSLEVSQWFYVCVYIYGNEIHNFYYTIHVFSTIYNFLEILGNYQAIRDF